MKFTDLAEDSEDSGHTPAERIAAATRSTWVSVAVNLVLTLLQIVAGIFSKSQGLIADGIHSLSDLVAERGPDLFRMKGIIQLQGEARRYVFQSVHMLLDGDFDRPWKPAEPPRTEFVIIGRDLDAEALRAGFLACIA